MFSMNIFVGCPLIDYADGQFDYQFFSGYIYIQQ